MPKLIPLSAVIPVYNRPALLTEALDSIQSGSVLPSQIIVILNSKKEDDLIAIQDWLKSSKKIDKQTITVANESIEGVANARNKGIGLAKNDWIAFLDSDDLWHPQKLARQWAYLKKRPFLHACQTKEIWIKNDRIIKQPRHLQTGVGKFLGPSIQYCLVSASGLLIHKHIFDRTGLFDTDLVACEDYDLWLRILVHFPIGLVDEKLTIKRSGGWEQLSHTTPNLDEYRIRALLKLVQNTKLSKDQYTLVFKSCLERYAILKAGSLKRYNQDRFALLHSQIQNTFADHIKNCSGSP